MLYPQKWMRRRTFDRLCAKLDKYENTLDELFNTRLPAALGHVLIKWAASAPAGARDQGTWPDQARALVCL
jgi:hypothetical protein